MKFFRRKKEKEPEEANPRKRTFEKKEVDDSGSSFKAFLKSTRPPKQKKGEIEIWTRNQRIFVIIVFLFTVSSSAMMALSARAWKLPNLPQLKLPSILSEETIIIEGRGQNARDKEVITKFNEMTDKLSGIYSFFVIRLSDGKFYGVREKETFEAASLNKLPVMLAMYQAAENGLVNLSTFYVLKEEDKIAGSGSLAGLPEGSKISYEELVQHMGHESDNTAFHITRNILGDDLIEKTMDEFGLPRVLLTENEAAPYDIAYFYRDLLEAKKVSRETRDAILEFLTDTIYENWISRNIPVRVAHKYGTLPHVKNDAGVVYANEPYILVVMSKGVVESEADIVIPEISSMIFDMENSK
jgi:beta-lactamase class A